MAHVHKDQVKLLNRVREFAGRWTRLRKPFKKRTSAVISFS
jgi:hypothetical protein